ncbi:hypothetical protein BJ165DRAFT_1529152 [Panaeolus papilionaceus]|nr:hypothetical protein BJ165DRAFT_1529152 [Panaeolus papilionaceus]
MPLLTYLKPYFKPEGRSTKPAEQIRSHGPAFTPDVWETIVDFIPDSPRQTLISLACCNRELCIILRRRIFNKVTFTIARDSRDGSRQLEPRWSASPKLLTVIKSRPAIAHCVKHLEIQVFVWALSPRSIWDYESDNFSITKLTPSLTNLKTLSFLITSPAENHIVWSTLPEKVRSAVHPLLHQVSDLRLERLMGVSAASIRQDGISALESLKVASLGTFQVGDTFPTPLLNGPTTSDPHRLKSLTIDSGKSVAFADWLTVDHPTFPITINHLEKLVFTGLQYQAARTPDHDFYRVLRRCAQVLRRLELLPTASSTYDISVKASIGNIESQRQIYSGPCPDLSSLINLLYLGISGATIDTYTYGRPQKNFSTSIPYIIKTLQTLPHHEDRRPPLEYLHVYLDIGGFEAHSLKRVDWSDFAECLLSDLRFSNLKEVFIDITYIYDSRGSSNYGLMRRVRLPEVLRKVLEENEELMKLKHTRGLVLGSTAKCLGD